MFLPFLMQKKKKKKWEFQICLRIFINPNFLKDKIQGLGNPQISCCLLRRYASNFWNSPLNALKMTCTCSTDVQAASVTLTN